MKTMLTVGRYFKSRFGSKVRKIPISLSGFTCPNIDGFKAKGGCIYCKNESFSPSLGLKKDEQSELKNLKNFKMNFSIDSNPILETQLKELEEQFNFHSNYHREKFKINKFMVYFQSFTNTYAPLETLKKLYTKALSFPNVIGMSIGTRVDCVNDELLDFLQIFVENGKEIWIEYGIQSIYEESLKITNRGHTMDGVKELFENTSKRGIKVCAHLIYGLPKESIPMMIHSLKVILSYGVHSLKIHPLYVVKGTPLANMYKKGEYSPISLEDYTDAIIQSLKIIPKDIVIQRVSAGVHDDSLIAPTWCFDKNIQMRHLRDGLKTVRINY